MAYLAPSILSADLIRLKEQIEIVEQCGADFIHVDVMDGHFVPNLTFGPVMVKAVKQISDVPADVHLMISNPEKYIADFAAAGASVITVHQETCTHLDRVIEQIKDENCKAGVSVNPATPVALLEDVLTQVDLVLVMSVNPGFGGQRFIRGSLQKIKRLSALRAEKEARFLIEVDGGINAQTAPEVLQAGADILVAGNAIFGQPDVELACRTLKSLVSSGAGIA